MVVLCCKKKHLLKLPTFKPNEREKSKLVELLVALNLNSFNVIISLGCDRIIVHSKLLIIHNVTVDLPLSEIC